MNNAEPKQVAALIHPKWVRCSVVGCKADIMPAIAAIRVQDFGAVLCETHIKGKKGVKKSRLREYLLDI